MIFRKHPKGVFYNNKNSLNCSSTTLGFVAKLGFAVTTTVNQEWQLTKSISINSCKIRWSSKYSTSLKYKNHQHQIMNHLCIMEFYYRVCTNTQFTRAYAKWLFIISFCFSRVKKKNKKQKRVDSNCYVWREKND